MSLTNAKETSADIDSPIKIHNKDLIIDIESLNTNFSKIMTEYITKFLQNKNSEYVVLYSGKHPIVSYHKDDFISAITYIKSHFNEFAEKSRAIKNNTYTYTWPEDALIANNTFTAQELIFRDILMEVIYTIPLESKPSKSILDSLWFNRFRYKKETQNVLRFTPIWFAALAIILWHIKQMDDPENITASKSRTQWEFGTYYSYTLEHNDLPNGLKIIHLSDIHLDVNHPENMEHLEKFANEMDSVDFVFLTGDMFHNGNIDAIQQNAAKVFHKIISKAGQWFFVLWNHDYYAEGESEKIIHLLDSVWYKNSTNTYYEITENGQKIGIAGLDDYKLWTPNTDKINIDTTGKTFNVMLEHNLDGYNPVQEKHSYVDLVLSGHTHSGEIEWWFVNATALIKWYENKNKQLTGRKRLLPTNTISYISPGFSTINPLGVRLGTNTAGATAIEFKKIQQ